MAKFRTTTKTWPVQSDDGTHEVRLVHAAFSMKVYIDNRLAYRKYMIFELGAVLPLTISGEKHHVRIFSDLSANCAYEFGPGHPAIYSEPQTLPQISQKAGPWVCVFERSAMIIGGAALLWQACRTYIFSIPVSARNAYLVTLTLSGLYLLLWSLRSLTRASIIARENSLSLPQALHRMDTANLRFNTPPGNNPKTTVHSSNPSTRFIFGIALLITFYVSWVDRLRILPALLIFALFFGLLGAITLYLNLKYGLSMRSLFQGVSKYPRD